MLIPAQSTPAVRNVEPFIRAAKCLLSTHCCHSRDVHFGRIADEKVHEAMPMITDFLGALT
jgi:hypothetical protein